MAGKSKGSLELVKLREKLGLTQEAVAIALGVTDHTIRNWEKGRSEPRMTIRQVKKLCEVFNCSLSDLPDDFDSVEESSN